MSKQQHTNGLIVPSPSTPLAPVPRPVPTEVSPEIRAELDRLRSENAALLAASTGSNKLTLKISAKGTGAVSLYGLGRFPVTLYAEQWTRLVDHAGEIRTFLAANRSKLSTKADSVARKAAAKKAAEKPATE